jgi:hypothetical protein
VRVFLIILWLFIVTNCGAQTQLPKELPQGLVISFNSDGGMVRSYKRITIKNAELDFEEMKGGNQQELEKWSATLSEQDLTKLYDAFVENRFDTIRNDQPTQMSTDVGSETISITIGARTSFQVTYGKNSPLSGRNLERYQAVNRAISDLVSLYKDRKF